MHKAKWRYPHNVRACVIGSTKRFPRRETRNGTFDPRRIREEFDPGFARVDPASVSELKIEIYQATVNIVVAWHENDARPFHV